MVRKSAIAFVAGIVVGIVATLPTIRELAENYRDAEKKAKSRYGALKAFGESVRENTDEGTRIEINQSANDKVVERGISDEVTFRLKDQ